MSIKRNFLYNIILNITNIAFPIVTLPYVSRLLGVEQIGVFNFINTYVGYFVLIAGLGIPLYGTREISKIKYDIQRTQNLFSEIFTINILATILASILFLISILIIPKLYEIKYLLLIYGISLYLAAFNIDWFFTGKENFKLITIRSIIIKSISVVLLFVFVKTRNDLIIYIIINLISLLGNQIWNFITLKKENIKIKLRFKNFKIHFKPLLFLLASAISVQIYLMVDTLMLGWMKGYYEVGIYSSGIKAIRIVMPIITSLGVVLLPRLSYYKENDINELNRLLEKSLNIIFFISIPTSFFFIIIAPTFVPFFFGKDFTDASIPMQIAAINILISNLSYFFAVQVLAILSFERKFLYSTLIGMATNISFNFLLISKYGAIGASISSVLAEIIVLFFSYKYSNSALKIKINFRNIISCFLSCIGFFILHILISSFDISAFIYLIVFSLTSWILYISIQWFYFKNEIFELLLIFFKKKSSNNFLI